MGKIVVADERGRISLPKVVPPYSLVPLWKDSTLYLVQLTDGMAHVGSLKATSLAKEMEKYRVKGLPLYLPRSYEPTNRITIPKAVRVSNLWELEETTFRFSSIGLEVPAYKLIPLKAIPIRGEPMCR